MKNMFLRLLLVAFLVVPTIILPDALHAQDTAFDADAATEAYLATLSGPEKEKSDAYFEGGYWLTLWSMVYGLVVAALLLKNRFSARLRDWCEARSKRRFLQTFMFGGVYIFLSSLLTFPWLVYTGFFREHQYELATQTFGAWFGEQMIGMAISIVMASLFIAGIYAIIRRVGERWWLWATGVTAVFLAVMIMISPIFIQPLFNDYTPLEEGEVKTAILEMAKAQGVEFDTVYMVDASAQSTRISANVSGLGATKRISLNDNLLNNSNLAEVKAVMGHELGHYVLGHLPMMIASFSLIFGLGYFVVSKTYDWANNRWGANWGLRGLEDIAGLPLVVALFSVFMFAMTPVFNSVIRINESQADIYGLMVAEEPDGFATIALKLAKYRKLDPTPLEEILFFTHPSGRTRVQMAMDWKAANQTPE